MSIIGWLIGGQFSFPNFPWGFAGFPEVVQNLKFVRRVHMMPKAFMGIHHQLSILGHALQRIAFQNQILTIIEVTIKNAAVKNKKTTVDIGCVRLGFFIKSGNGGTFDNQLAKPARRMNAGKSGNFAM
jgi:hypothetical protein